MEHKVQKVEFHMLEPKAKALLMKQDRYLDIMADAGKVPEQIAFFPSEHRFLVNAIKAAAKAHRISKFDPQEFRYRGAKVIGHHG